MESSCEFAAIEREHGSVEGYLAEVLGVDAFVAGLPAEERERQLRVWKKAVTRTFDWVEV